MTKLHDRNAARLIRRELIARMALTGLVLLLFLGGEGGVAFL